MDVSDVRAQIKSWERQFKAEHGRDPSVQDIRQIPEIAEKYKLYKKLSKAAPRTTQQTPNDPPSTPIRSAKRDTRPSLLLSRPRVVETTTASIQSHNNPFSPVKDKGKQRDLPSAFRSQEKLRSNLFATPSKLPKSQREVSDGSSDELPGIIPFLQHTASTSTQVRASAGNAVSRARKRLRGEPVSPSPNKDKRRRIGFMHDPLPFAQLGSPNPVSDDEDGYGEDTGANASFVDDSPVKAPVGGRSFKLLFEEALPKKGTTATVAKQKGSVSRSKTTPSAPVGLFKDRIDRAAVLAKEDMDQDIGISTKRNRGTIPKPIFGTIKRSLGKEDLFSGGDDDMQHRVKLPSASETNSRHSSRKRSLSDSDADSDGGNDTPAQIAPKLIPPSPPPSNTSQHPSFHSTAKGKGKAPAAGSRKKAKVQKEADEDEGDEESSDEIPVKLVVRNGYYRARRTSAEGDPNFEFDYDSDPIMGSYTAQRGPREPTTHLPSQAEHADPAGTRLESGKFEVDLPDRLRHVLAISPSRTRDSRGERVVRGLLSGRRATHYDSAKGGEIWDVGEEEDETRGVDTEAEDDWEGPGVPWEAAEL